VIQRVKKILDAHEIQHAVIGAMAMAARGFPRFTLDFDFLTTNKSVLDLAIWQELIHDKIVVDVRKGDFDDPLAGVVRIGDPAEVDIVVGKWKWEQRVVNEAEPLQIAGMLVPVAKASDLILMKLNAGGYQAHLDILGLLEVGPREQLIAEVDAKLGDFPSTAEKTARTMWATILAESP
jgi:hypothetical protein